MFRKCHCAIFSLKVGLPSQVTELQKVVGKTIRFFYPASHVRTISAIYLSIHGGNAKMTIAF